VLVTMASPVVVTVALVEVLIPAGAGEGFASYSILLPSTGRVFFGMWGGGTSSDFLFAMPCKTSALRA
jgi:hypothetical protein